MTETAYTPGLKLPEEESRLQWELVKIGDQWRIKPKMEEEWRGVCVPIHMWRWEDNL